MNKRTKILIINYLMLISLITVFISGILLKPFPGMIMGITHGLSGFIMVICAFIHCLQHNMLKK